MGEFVSEDDTTTRQRLVAAEPSVPAAEPRLMRECEVVERWEESPRYLGVHVRVPSEFRQAHQRPGQYVTLSPGTQKPRFLVIASPHDRSEETWEFLVDRDTEVGRCLESLDDGDSLSVSPPEGAGFPVEEIGEGPLYCFTTGSGIASVNPVVEWMVRRPSDQPADMVLYHGEYAHDDHPYREREKRWSEGGVRLVRCDETKAPIRYVQQAFLSDDRSLEGSRIFLAGAPVMKKAVLEMLDERDFPIDRVHTNV
jgi:ferredoxin-NADP reductase